MATDDSGMRVANVGTYVTGVPANNSTVYSQTIDRTRNMTGKGDANVSVDGKISFTKKSVTPGLYTVAQVSSAINSVMIANGVYQSPSEEVADTAMVMRYAAVLSEHLYKTLQIRHVKGVQYLFYVPVGDDTSSVNKTNTVTTADKDLLYGALNDFYISGVPSNPNMLGAASIVSSCSSSSCSTSSSCSSSCSSSSSSSCCSTSCSSTSSSSSTSSCSSSSCCSTSCSSSCSSSSSSSWFVAFWNLG